MRDAIDGAGERHAVARTLWGAAAGFTVALAFGRAPPFAGEWPAVGSAIVWTRGRLTQLVRLLFRQARRKIPLLGCRASGVSKAVADPDSAASARASRAFRFSVAYETSFDCR